jgi:predicted nucleic-acid-binding protein
MGLAAVKEQIHRRFTQKSFWYIAGQILLEAYRTLARPSEKAFESTK